MAKVMQVFEDDHGLVRYEEPIMNRINEYTRWIKEFNDAEGGLLKFAEGYKKYGFVRDDLNKRWVFTEWLPAAMKVYLIGDFNNWQETHPLKPGTFGTWSIDLPDKPDGEYLVPHGCNLRIKIKGQDGSWFDRVPAWTTYAVQDQETNIFNAQMYCPEESKRYKFKNSRPARPDRLKIYESHVGMGSVEPKVASYTEFKDTVLPRIKKLGYNAVQFMAIAEHAYYGSFGYHVTSFFAPASRSGTPDQLKELIDAAHGMGLIVLMDLVHAHMSSNHLDGIAGQDGSDYCYSHAGPLGRQEQWDSTLFHYNKWEVLRFLLSNCRWWLEEYGFDGFRFDGVTSMLYNSHGINKCFMGYDDYFGADASLEAHVYLMLANDLIHKLLPNSAVTIAEDVSGMPTLCRSIADGGFGFDYRLAMALPDMWTKLLKDFKDDKWNMGYITHELQNRRWKEKCIAYVESHDQCIVGDKTCAFLLMDKEMYTHMSTMSAPSLIIDRGLALHKMIRLVTLGLGGEGFLCFIGNEFGHPEWVDFPTERNGWSYQHCRRRFDLADDSNLKFKFFLAFDVAMNEIEDRFRFLGAQHQFCSRNSEEDKIIVFERGDCLFVFNFHPTKSFNDYRIGSPWNECMRVVLDSDEERFGGQGRLAYGHTNSYPVEHAFDNRRHSIKLYLPCRTCQVLVRDSIVSQQASPSNATGDGVPQSVFSAKATSQPPATAVLPIPKLLGPSDIPEGKEASPAQQNIPVLYEVETPTEGPPMGARSSLKNAKGGKLPDFELTRDQRERGYNTTGESMTKMASNAPKTPKVATDADGGKGKSPSKSGKGNSKGEDLLPKEKRANQPEAVDSKSDMLRVSSFSALGNMITEAGELVKLRKEAKEAPAAPAKPKYAPKCLDTPLVVVSSEVNPWSKTGGLAMVASSYGYELAMSGHRTMVVSPMYSDFEDCTYVGKTNIWLDGFEHEVGYFHQYQSYGDGKGADYIFVAHICYHRPAGLYWNPKEGCEYGDNLFRFALLTLAAMEAPLLLNLGGSTYGEKVLFIANDWQAGLLPAYLKYKYRKNSTYLDARCMFVIHNIGYQGKYPLDKFPVTSHLGLPEEATEFVRGLEPGCINLLSCAVKLSDRVITVSPNYTKEIQTPEGGEGMQEILKAKGAHLRLGGILNGIADEWNPKTDSILAANYSIKDFEAGKAKCKAFLQKKLGLRVDPNVALLGFCGRLTSQKGIHLISEMIPWLTRDEGNEVTGKVQILLMGKGEVKYEQDLQGAEANNKGMVCAYVGFKPEIEHEMMAGCDFLLMPSQYEPCGLPQMYAQAYGTLPIVHATGGLKDSVFGLWDEDRDKETATGFLFDGFDVNHCKERTYQALEVFHKKKALFKQMQENAMKQNYYWPPRIEEYEQHIDWTMQSPSVLA